MSLPRACHVCGEIHRAGERCAVARANWEARRGNSGRRYGAGWGTISRRILKRDRYVCQLQLAGCTGRADTVDHLVPRSQGGLSTESNLAAACKRCNGRKGARTVA